MLKTGNDSRQTLIMVSRELNLWWRAYRLIWIEPMDGILYGFTEIMALLCRIYFYVYFVISKLPLFVNVMSDCTRYYHYISVYFIFHNMECTYLISSCANNFILYSLSCLICRECCFLTSDCTYILLINPLSPNCGISCGSHFTCVRSAG